MPSERKLGQSGQSSRYSMDYWNNLFQDTEYWDAYQSILNKYNVSTPNTFWGILTGKNATNQYEHSMARNDELNALYQKMRDEEYQSYSNQVQEQRKAGLNPDLNGVQAGQVGQSSSTGVPNVSAENPFSTLMSIFGMATSFQSILSSGLQLDSMRLDNQQKMDSFALSYLVDNVSPQSFDNGELSQDIRFGLIDTAAKFGRKFYGFNGRQARSFRDAVTRKMDSPEFLKSFYGFMNEAETSRSGYLNNISQPFYDQQDETMRLLLGPMLKSEFNTRKKRADTEYKHLDNLSVDYDMQKSENAWMSEVYKGLYTSYKDGNTFSGVVLWLIKQHQLFEKLGVDAVKGYFLNK